VRDRMKFLRIQLLIFALLGLGSVSHAAPKPLLVYYMPWYMAKPFSSTWGWHWTMNHFDPDTVNAAWERQIASWYYPMIGPYDSANPAVLEYHVLLMKLAGIDGIVVDWYGPDDYLDYGINNQRTAAIFQYARKAGLKFCLCYEDQTVQQEINGGFIKGSNAIAHAQQTMLYVQTNYFLDTNYLRWNNQPVLLNFGPQFFKTNSQWQQIFSVLPNPPAFFTEDNRLPAGQGAFDWPPMWLSQAPGTEGVLSGAALEGYLSGFQQNGRAWPAFVSSAFPRFHDVYQQAGVRDYWGYLGDKQGETLRATLSRALTNNSFLAQVVTWNDFGEGTMVEPTVEYGYRDLGIIQENRRLYLDPGFSHGTNDLMLAEQLYHLRSRLAGNSSATPKLDAIFNAIVSNDLTGARQKLAEFDSK
jgi:hypothetical protein